MRAIAKELGRPLTTVSNTVKRFKLTGSHLSKEGRGRKTKLTARDHAYIRKISMRDRRKTVPVITEEFNSGRKDKVSASCVRRSLIKSDMRARVAAKKPFLRKPNVKKRLAFALKHVRWSKKSGPKCCLPTRVNLNYSGTIAEFTSVVEQVSGSEVTAFCQQ